MAMAGNLPAGKLPAGDLPIICVYCLSFFSFLLILLVVKIDLYYVILAASLTIFYVGCYWFVRPTHPSEKLFMRFRLGLIAMLSLFLLFNFLLRDLVKAILNLICYIFVLGIFCSWAQSLHAIGLFLTNQWNQHVRNWHILFFLCLTLAPHVVKIDLNVYYVILAAFLTIFYVGCYQFVRPTHPSEKLVMRVRLGWIAMLSLFLLFNFLLKDLVNAILNLICYIFVIGIFCSWAPSIRAIRPFGPNQWNQDVRNWHMLFIRSFNEIKKKMEKERHKEGTEVEKKDLVTSHTPLLPREPYIWLMITDGENDSERHIFYSITENRYYIRFVSELQNKYVACCYGGLLVLRDKSTNDCSILNILTMERLNLPPLHIPPVHHIETLNTNCVISSPKMERSCRVIFINRRLRKFWSCHLGDSEFIERELTCDGRVIRELINYKGKLYALTDSDWNLIAFDFSDLDLNHEQIVSGKSLKDSIFTGLGLHFYLVESCEDLLLISMGSYDYEVCDVKIFKADFSIGKWVKLETLGDRAIFLGSRNNTFSVPATSIGMKGNAVYWVGLNSFQLLSADRHLYKYEIEDKSISIILPFPTVRTYSSLYWVSFPMIFNGEKKPDRSSSLFEITPIKTNFQVQRGKATTIESTELQILQRKTKKREETETIVRKESLWADLPNDLLLEIFPHLIAGDRVAFRSVCSSWYSPSPSFRTSQQFVHPLKSSDCSSPLLMCPDNKAYNPIHDELYSMEFLDEAPIKIRAARDGWLLMDYQSTNIFFYNPFTREHIFLPFCNAKFVYSVFFSEPPTSSDCLVVVAAMRIASSKNGIWFMRYGDEKWTCRELSEEVNKAFHFSSCNAVVYNDLYYFLGYNAKLLIFYPKKDVVRVIEAPKFISKLKAEGGQQYLLESDGKLMAVFVATDGSSIYTCEWNVRMRKWEILGNLGNTMLFVSRPLSLSKKATVSGSGNKIYFPRVVGDGHILFYSLATKRYHTFEMGTSYSNFFASKFYSQYNGWFVC